MLSCWHDLLFFLSPTVYIFLPSVGWLCGVGVLGLIECSHSLLALHGGLQLIIMIIIQDQQFNDETHTPHFIQEDPAYNLPVVSHSSYHLISRLLRHAQWQALAEF